VGYAVGLLEVSSFAPRGLGSPSARKIWPARRIMARSTTAQTASATHTYTGAKLLIALACATVPTTKLQAAYMPTGKTVDQRRTS
jgi:hypothetical protein